MRTAGVDEVGVGCLAGPVISAAVSFGNQEPSVIFKDSKKISHLQRTKLYKYIKNNFHTSIGIATPYEVDKFNVLKATHLAMKRAINNLPVVPELILIDGLYVPDGVDNAESIVKGDEIHQEIAAASIYAKCYRDKLMEIYGVQYSQYSLEKNKGYPTKEHKSAINEHGLSNIHRKSFKI